MLQEKSKFTRKSFLKKDVNFTEKVQILLEGVKFQEKGMRN